MVSLSRIALPGRPEATMLSRCPDFVVWRPRSADYAVICVWPASS
ncbi:MAG TPA: hypothetical protein RMH80_21225 [Polyangiaceae bacterium LLY-WYZ-15_(1-7)]|nr:hypothetical protein [Polyangiaceae bacterium LLY-WYZ-15_(1-7)]